MSQNGFQKVSWVLPGVATGMGGALLWLTVGKVGDGLAFMGWVGILLIAATLAAIFLAAHHPSPRTAYLGVLIAIAANVCIVSALNHFLPFAKCVGLIVIIAGWSGLWWAVTGLMWGWTRVRTTIIPIVLAMFLFASPILMAPAVSPARPWLVQFVRFSCPMFACLGTARPDIKIDWPVLPPIYRATRGIWQEVPFDPPNAWLLATIYVSLALLLLAISHFKSRKPQDRPAPAAR